MSSPRAQPVERIAKAAYHSPLRHSEGVAITPCTQGAKALDFKYEVTVLPVSDVDRAKEFYADRLGFVVNVELRAGENLCLDTTGGPP